MNKTYKSYLLNSVSFSIMWYISLPEDMRRPRLVEKQRDELQEG